MQGNIKVLVPFFLLCISAGAIGQSAVRGSTNKDSSNLLFPSRSYNNLLPLGKSFAPVKPSFQLARDEVVRNFAFFCKTEWLLEKKSSVPFKFRLGSLEQSDYLEGKPNTKRY